MTLEEAVSYFGSQYRLCIALDCPPQAFSYWRKQNRLPAIHQLKLHIFTTGHLAADEEFLIQEGFYERTYRQGMIINKKGRKNA